MNPEIVLIDLSSVAHPIWHVSQSEPDPNTTSTRTVARVRALANGHPHVAVCCDSGRSFRKDIDPNYKAQRPETDATLQHQITLARETLVNDGFPVWAAKGFEADDLIATAVKRSLAEIPDSTVLIASSDKDLLQLVGPRVAAKSLTSGAVIDESGVIAKFGVKPEQMTDYLSLVGDASDNVKGAKGIGPKGAASLLFRFGDIETLYAKLAEASPQDLGLKPSEATSLEEFAARREATRSLIALRTDVEIPFDEITKERRPKDADMLLDGEDEPETTEEMTMTTEDLAMLGVEPEPETITRTEEHVQSNGRTVQVQTQTAPAPAPKTDLLADVIAATPAEWERQLEPRSMRDAQTLAENLFKSRLFSAYATAPGVLAVILAGRELGIQAMASLRAFHLIDGTPRLEATFIRALVLKSKLPKYFRCTERTATRATFETQRGDDPPVSLSCTIEEGRQAFAGDDKKWAASGWGKNPADMLVARAGTKLARLVYPEVCFGLYAVEEFDNV